MPNFAEAQIADPEDRAARRQAAARAQGAAPPPEEPWESEEPESRVAKARRWQRLAAAAGRRPRDARRVIPAGAARQEAL